MSGPFQRQHIVRPLALSDVPKHWFRETATQRTREINHLLNLSAPNSPELTTDGIRRLIKSGFAQIWVLVEVELGEIIAMATLQLLSQLSGQQARLVDLSVHEHFRGQGAEELMCQAVVLKARRLGIRALDIVVQQPAGDTGMTPLSTNGGSLFELLGWKRLNDASIMRLDPRLVDTSGWKTEHIVMLDTPL
jgi:hypothetical protein